MTPAATSRVRGNGEAMNWVARLIGGRFHYGWLTVAVVFLVLLAAAGTRATPSGVMVPLEHQFGWSRATISLAISVNIALYGLTGPFVAAAMQRFGVRPTLLAALGTMVGRGAVASVVASACVCPPGARRRRRPPPKPRSPIRSHWRSAHWPRRAGRAISGCCSSASS